jgi:type II secretory pathway pseudopilin PulG
MELLVVTAIIVVVSAIALANNAKFGGTVLLEDFAYNVALTIRQAQVYSISVHRTGSNCLTSGSTCFAVPYGVHFSLSSPTQYVLYADANVNGVYDSGEAITSYALQNGYSIYKLCVASSNITLAACKNPSDSGSLHHKTLLDIYFQRPEPDAQITADVNDPCIPTAGGGGGTCQPYSFIVFQSPRGDYMGVAVQGNGQVYVTSK